MCCQLEKLFIYQLICFFINNMKLENLISLSYLRLYFIKFLFYLNYIIEKLFMEYYPNKITN